MTINRWGQARKILCIRLDYLGDVLMMTPAIRALKHAQTDRYITLMTSPGGAAAVPFIPEIDDVITYAAPWMKSSAQHHSDLDLDMIRRLQAEQYDGAVIFTTYSQSPLPAAMLCYLAGIPLRLAHCRENPYQMLTDWVPDPEPDEKLRHEVRRQLDLVAAIDCHTPDQRLSFRVDPADSDWVDCRLGALDIDPFQPWIVLHPGATAASRRYPAQHWTQVARELAERYGYPLLFTGSEAELPLVEEIRAGIRQARSLAGELDLGKLAALISRAPLLISNNTGPAHIAAALGTPVVDLYALTNPQHTPWQVPNRVLFEDVSCRFCYKSVCPQGHHRCLSAVAPQRVVAAALELLAHGCGHDKSATAIIAART